MTHDPLCPCASADPKHERLWHSPPAVAMFSPCDKCQCDLIIRVIGRVEKENRPIEVRAMQLAQKSARSATLDDARDIVLMNAEAHEKVGLPMYAEVLRAVASQITYMRDKARAAETINYDLVKDWPVNCPECGYLPDTPNHEFGCFVGRGADALDRHGNENSAVIDGERICFYTYADGDYCGLPWNHAEDHR